MLHFFNTVIIQGCIILLNSIHKAQCFHRLQAQKFTEFLYFFNQLMFAVGLQLVILFE